MHCSLMLLAAINAPHFKGCNVVQQLIEAEVRAEVDQVLSKAALEHLEYLNSALCTGLGFQQFPQQMAIRTTGAAAAR